ncbi:ABC transporter permease [Ferruginibacter sp. SUN106]|uniref:ABC transporter permease n=1 Tax=Ferruginibacter sp. SUN106 TaxID=2978348 RepID=UPI003D35C1C4
MFNLFKIEWLKIKTYRTFWVLYLSYMLFTPLFIIFVAYKFMSTKYSNFEEMTLKALAGTPFIFPKIWHSTTYFSGLFFIVLAMLFILLITNEVQYRTHRQNIIDGWSRLDFIKAKFSLLIFFVLSAAVITFLTALIIGFTYSPSGADIIGGLKYIGYFILMSTIYLVVAFLVAILVKRTGLSIIIYFVLVVILDNLLWLGLTFKQSQVGYFLPLETVDSLIPNPFKPAAFESRTVSDMALMISAAIYLAAYIYTIVRYFRTTDLKT